MKYAAPILLLLPLLTVGARSLSMANAPYEFAGRDGIWVSVKTGDHAFRELALSVADQRIALQKLESVFKILESSSVLKPLKGVALRADKLVYARADASERYSNVDPIVLKVGLTIGNFMRDPNGRIIPFTIEKPRIEIYTNDIEMTAASWNANRLWHEGLTDNEGRDYFLEPQTVAKTENGQNIYRLDDSVEEVVLTNGRPLWISATSEQFLLAMMNNEINLRAKEIEDDRQSGRSPVPGDQSFHVRRLKMFEEELAALTREERNQPAYYARSTSFDEPMRSGLAKADLFDARPIVTVNPDYFDQSLSRTAIQLIACQFNYQIPYSSQDNDGQGDVSISLLNELGRRLEYEELEALIERTK